MDQYIAFEKPEIQYIHQAIEQWLAQQTITNDDFGLIHGDLREANVICDGNTIHFIDFDEPVYHWWTQDIARAFLNIVNQDISVWKKPFTHFISGYRSVKDLPKQSLQQIPWFIKNKTLEIYLWTKNNWHDPVAPGGGSTEYWLSEMRGNILNPDWLVRLEEICQTIEN